MSDTDRKSPSLRLLDEVSQPDDERVTEFVRLFTTYEVRLRAFAMTLLANHADVEDVLQQANLTLWAKFDEFQLGTNFMAWAGRVLYLKVQQHRRKQTREKLQFGDAYQDAILNEAIRGDLVNELGDRERALAECIANLRPEHREMLRARYDEQTSMERMADKFNRSREAIYNTLSRVRRALYDCVTDNVQAKARHARR
ncbi:MAG: polymerase sigma-70 factor, Rhodopirellula/Verrucomicrobium family [Phycisphaerales bacterium]|nr:polymerase sigma-70 factor, Rhodopirellula/Verrucomicrobium family [Phycisphaerales bacterium]